MRNLNLLAAAALVALVPVSPPALAQEGEAVETFICESPNDRHNECRYRSQGTVTVHVQRQMSRAPCVFNQSWGTFDGGVWVDNGCRAEFVVRRPPGQRSHRPVGGGLQTITCESRERDRQHCSVPNIDAGSVHIERQLSSSPCRQGESWGVSEGENSPPGVWVSRGCRATFSYSTRGGSRGSYSAYAGTPYDFELECESLRGEWKHCNVDQVHSARVEIIAGNDACNVYKSWGVDDTGIWVRGNCQGAFRVKYRH